MLRARRRFVALGGPIGIVLLIVASWGTLGRAGQAQNAGVLLTGAITSASGEKMEGVVISARASGQSFTTSVYTDASGEYVFPRLPAGPYKVWAQAVGFEAGRADLGLSGSVQRQNFTLAAKKGFESQLSGDRWVDGLPEATPEDQRMKTVFRVSCGGCHSQGTALLTRFDEKGWKNIITVMSRIQTSGIGPNDTEDRPPNPLLTYYRDRLAAYLAKVRGPGPSPARWTPRERPKGDAVLAVFREYDVPGQGYGLPMWEDGTDWSEGPPSKTNRKNHHAMDGTLDFQGNLFTSDDLNTNPYRTLSRIDWRTGEITNIKVPRRGDPRMASAVHDVITDQDGIIWFGAEQNGDLVRLDPKTLQWEAMKTPDGQPVPSGGFNAVDGKGGVWSATRGASRYDPKTKTVVNFQNPIQKTKLGSAGTYGMAADRDGNGWLSQYGFDVMIKHNLATGKSENIQLPPPPTAPEPGLFSDDDRRIFDMMGGSLYQGHGSPWLHTVRKPGGDPKGDSVWGPGWTSDQLIRIDIVTSRITVSPFPHRDVGAYQSVVDNDGMVWHPLTNADAVTKFDPKTGAWTWYDLPTRGTETHGMQVATVNGRTQLGIPYWGSAKMAKVEFLTREERDALKNDARSAR